MFTHVSKRTLAPASGTLAARSQPKCLSCGLEGRGPLTHHRSSSVKQRQQRTTRGARALASNSKNAHLGSLGSLYGVKGVSLGLRNKKAYERGSLVSNVRAAKPEIGDRIIASVPYLLPLMDGVRYGRFFFQEFPQFYALLAPLQPLLKTYYTLPFAGLVAFFALYYGVVQNYNLSRFVRYNAMQSILLDILLIIPSLLENFVLRGIPKTGAYLQVTVSFYNFVWLYVLICFLYGVGSCLVGEQARLPGVADAADRQVM